MKAKSLVRRAIVAVLLIELCCALTFAGTAVWHEWKARLKALDVSIKGRADSLIGAVQDAEDPEDHVMVDSLEFHPPANDVYAVYNLDGKRVGTSTHAPEELVALVQDGFHDVTLEGHEYRVLQTQAMRIIDREETGGVGRRRPTIVIYAVRMDHLWHEVREAITFYGLMSLVLLFVTAGSLIYLLQRLLAPLQELAGAAAGIHADSLEFHSPASVRRVRELVPLADALSSTITRLRLAFEKEQRFINDAAHELKTAVAVVRSTVQLLGMRHRSAEEYERGLGQVLEDNQRVEELVAQMLTLAKASERADEALVEVDLGREAAAALKTVASVAEHRGVRLAPELEQGVRVMLPANAVQVVVSNLVMNAVQHSESEAEIRIVVRRSAEGERRAVLEVQDFGSGIAEENLPHVFERFFREDPSRSRETGGVGLGLAICKGIVESADGVIDLRSVQGKGTTVRVAFRLA